MIFQELPYHEWSEIAPLLERFGETGKPDRRAKVFVLRDDHEVLGCVVAETVIHLGPFYVKPECRNTSLGGLLVRNIARALPDDVEVHVIAMNEATEKLCEGFGLERIPGSLFIREAKHG